MKRLDTIFDLVTKTAEIVLMVSGGYHFSKGEFAHSAACFAAVAAGNSALKKGSK